MSDDLDTGGSSDSSSGSDGSFSASDFSTAASAIASPEATSPEAASAEPTDEAAPVDAAAAPAAAAVPEKPKGPIPFEVHHTALNNARVKAREEASAEFDQKFGWARRVTPQQFSDWTQTANRMVTDPVGFISEFQRQLAQDPRYAAQVRTQQSPATPDAPPQPDVQIVDAQGHVVGMSYSDKQTAKLLAFNEARMEAKFQKQLQPFQQMHAQAQEREEQQRITSRVDAQLSEASTWPYFSDHQQAIGVEVNNGADLQSAYLTVLKRDIYPALATRERASVMEHLTHKTTASTASPSGGQTSVSKRDSDKSWTDLFREKAVALGI
jgi:hypothetical protein